MKKQTMGERISSLRREYNLTKAEFAKLSEVSALTVGNIERGITQSFQPDTINTIVKVFGTTREWLTEGRGAMLPVGKLDLANPKAAGGEWKDEAWSLAKEQIEKKDALLNMLAISFDRVTKMMQDSGMSFLHHVKKTA